MPAAFWALLLIPSAQAPLARWTPELAFSAKRVGGVAISPDGRWAAVEMSEPVMEPEVSEWRSSIRVYPVARMGLGTARVEPAASAPAWSPNGHWLALVSTPAGTRGLWRGAVGGGTGEQVTRVDRGVGGVRWAADGRGRAHVLQEPA